VKKNFFSKKIKIEKKENLKKGVGMAHVCGRGCGL
jgi:hypothetical protein